MDAERMTELRRVMFDTNVPTSNRLAAAVRYEKLLEDAANECESLIQKIKKDCNESANTA